MFGVSGGMGVVDAIGMEIATAAGMQIAAAEIVGDIAADIVMPAQSRQAQQELDHEDRASKYGA
jgi:hypothetical protein